MPNPISPVILHIPHSSTWIPKELRHPLLLSDTELADELLVMTDHFTEELFSASAVPTTSVTFPISRIIVDPERFEDDAQELMSRVGMGVIYTKTSTGRTLRHEPPASERLDLLNRFYRPHHRMLDTTVAQAIASHGRCLIVDCHSYPSKRLPYELSADAVRPGICIGTDPFHTPSEVQTAAFQAFQALGFDVALNTPFSGALVPLCRYGSDKRVAALMIEVRRDLYMDEASGKKSQEFEDTRAKIAEAIAIIRSAFKK